ncbi:MAG: hypothetical protein ACR2ND_11845, partial [Solirubrobacteraceae bacterium]
MAKKRVAQLRRRLGLGRGAVPEPPALLRSQPARGRDPVERPARPALDRENPRAPEAPAAPASDVSRWIPSELQRAEPAPDRSRESRPRETRVSVWLPPAAAGNGSETPVPEREDRASVWLLPAVTGNGSEAPVHEDETGASVWLPPAVTSDRSAASVREPDAEPPGADRPA